MTINGLRSTIRYDEDVFRWALGVIEASSVQNILPKRKLFLFKAAHILVMALNGGVLYVVLKILLSAPRPADFLSILTIAAGVYLLEIPYKRLTADLVSAYIEKSFGTEELEGKTLLQVGLLLERKLGVPAMIESLHGWTNIFRMLFLAGYALVSRISLFFCGIWAITVLSRSTTLGKILKRSF